MNIGEKEIAAMNYEIFIRRAFKCSSHEHGAHADYFRILADTAPDYRGKIPQSFDTQLANIISNLNKATDRFLIRFKPNSSEQVSLVDIKKRLQYANSAEMIKEIVHEGIEITQRFKDFS